MRKMKIGFVGVGAISGIYLKNLTRLFKEVEVIGVIDDDGYDDDPLILGL